MSTSITQSYPTLGAVRCSKISKMNSPHTMVFGGQRVPIGLNLNDALQHINLEPGIARACSTYQEANIAHLHGKYCSARL
ncbi:uncharacterized protein F4812DRAFT_407788 [Daldinia caldariorum]|uniref:uncharacterized protein n=1 Tax=Daldinia caldariorum TaxID=326644 RepID=UPI002008467E|nr:uncharacterized protein F4812DRAFT_407788 [Daldinia caldariorum]KAI1472204.1 hypothetical protein F4812DRAFT_407788 [Daldinia caldariorum]